MFIERRKAQRISKNLIIQYQLKDEPNHWNASEVKNFSEVGMLITADRALTIDTIIYFRFKLPINPLETCDLVGRVVHCDKNPNLTLHFISIEIIEISPEVKEMIRSYVAWYKNKGSN